jgi:predicted kinase
MKNKGELIILVGISGSGKSTWSQKEWELNPTKTVIVNRDKIRELLFGFTEAQSVLYYQRTDLNKLENQVTKYQDELISFSLRNGKKVIVDNTHLKQSYLNEYSKYDCSKRFILFNINRNEAVERDRNRKRRVGSTVIDSQIKQLNTLLGKNYVLGEGLQQMPEGIFEVDFDLKSENKTIVQCTMLPKAIICDIDGCLAQMTDRNPYDWNRVYEDKVQEHIKNIVNFHFENGYEVFIFTGRDGSCYGLTKEWLEDNGVKFHHLYSRKEKDQRKDSVIKEELFREHVMNKYYVELVIDDRMQVIRMWNDLGLTVLSNNPLAIEF